MTERPCAACGRMMQAKTERKKWCSSSCRANVSTGRVVPLRQPVTPATPTAKVGRIAAAVRAELAAVGREDTALGVAALVLAERLDSGEDSGTAFSALSRELRATMTEALRGTVRSSVAALRDELAARRQHG